MPLSNTFLLLHFFSFSSFHCSLQVADHFSLLLQTLHSFLSSDLSLSLSFLMILSPYQPSLFFLLLLLILPFNSSLPTFQFTVALSSPLIYCLSLHIPFPHYLLTFLTYRLIFLPISLITSAYITFTLFAHDLSFPLTFLTLLSPLPFSNT